MEMNKEDQSNDIFDDDSHDTQVSLHQPSLIAPFVVDDEDDDNEMRDIQIYRTKSIFVNSLTMQSDVISLPSPYQEDEDTQTSLTTDECSKPASSFSSSSISFNDQQELMSTTKTSMMLNMNRKQDQQQEEEQQLECESKRLKFISMISNRDHNSYFDADRRHDSKLLILSHQRSHSSSNYSSFVIDNSKDEDKRLLSPSWDEEQLKQHKGKKQRSSYYESYDLPSPPRKKISDQPIFGCFQSSLPVSNGNSNNNNPINPFLLTGSNASSMSTGSDHHSSPGMFSSQSPLLMHQTTGSNVDVTDSLNFDNCHTPPLSTSDRRMIQPRRYKYADASCINTVGVAAFDDHQRFDNLQFHTPESRLNKDFIELDIIGNGSFGIVRKVRSRMESCLYAIKESRNPFRGSNEKDKALKEVFALAALSTVEENSHVVRYFDSWIEDQKLFIKTELCDENLTNYLKNHCNDRSSPEHLETISIEILKQILDGLKCLHSHHMVHLDLKPDNIFVKGNVFKIGDFGHVSMFPAAEKIKDDPGNDNMNISVVDSSFDKENHQMQLITIIDDGDPRYMAKELLRDEHNHLPKADIFSLGASIYEVFLQRRLPPNGDEWADIRDGKLDADALSKMSSNMQELIKIMMHPDPGQRPTAEDLLKSGGPGEILLPNNKKNDQFDVTNLSNSLESLKDVQDTKNQSGVVYKIRIQRRSYSM